MGVKTTATEATRHAAVEARRRRALRTFKRVAAVGDGGNAAPGRAGVEALEDSARWLNELALGVARGDSAAVERVVELLDDLATVVERRMAGLTTGEPGAPTQADRMDAVERAQALEECIGIPRPPRGASGNRHQRDDAGALIRAAAVEACQSLAERQRWPDGTEYLPGHLKGDPDSSRAQTDVARKLASITGTSVSGASVRKWCQMEKGHSVPGAWSRLVMPDWLRAEVDAREEALWDRLHRDEPG